MVGILFAWACWFICLYNLAINNYLISIVVLIFSVLPYIIIHLMFVRGYLYKIWRIDVEEEIAINTTNIQSPMFPLKATWDEDPEDIEYYHNFNELVMDLEWNDSRDPDDVNIHDKLGRKVNVVTEALDIKIFELAKDQEK